MAAWKDSSSASASESCRWSSTAAEPSGLICTLHVSRSTYLRNTRLCSRAPASPGIYEYTSQAHLQLQGERYFQLWSKNLQGVEEETL